MLSEAVLESAGALVQVACRPVGRSCLAGWRASAMGRGSN